MLILADDLGWNDLSFAGGGVAGGTVPTPHIDSLAAEGVSFTQGYAANATCAPSRAALMSGRYPTRFGFEFTPTPAGMMQIVPRLRTPVARLRHPIVHEGVASMPFEELGLPSSEITIAELLADHGYHTVHVGKWHLGSSSGMSPVDQGFDESLVMRSQLYLPEDHPDVVNSKQDFDPIDRFLWAASRFAVSENVGELFVPDRYLTDYFTEQALRVIDANRDRPFFLYLAHWAPHTPLQATREDYEALSHIENHRERVYAAMIRALDRGVGRVLDALERNGLEENTLVLFTSDNGGAGYIGLPEVNHPYRGWKLSYFNGGIRVPFFARWPAHIAAGSEVDDPVASLRPLRHRSGGCGSSAARGSQDRRRRPAALRHRRGQRRATRRPLLAQRRLAERAHRGLEAQRERSARSQLALRPSAPTPPSSTTSHESALTSLPSCVPPSPHTTQSRAHRPGRARPTSR